MTTVFAQCYNCTHFMGGGQGVRPVCIAFPDGIPQEIRLNEVDHRKPIEGDNGIRYTPISSRVPHPLSALEPQPPSCFFCGEGPLLPYPNPVCSGCEREAMTDKGERRWERPGHPGPFRIQGVQVWIRYPGPGGHFAMADPDGAASYELFLKAHGRSPTDQR